MAVVAETIPVGLESAGTLMTPAEFDAIEEWDENYRYELIHGVLVVAALPLPTETAPNEALGVWLYNYRQRHPQGRQLDGSLPEQYVQVKGGRRRADRLIWAGLGRTPRVKSDVASIAVEFVSNSKRDRHRDYEEKKDEYMEAGIDEYWIIDRFRRIMTVVRNGPKGYTEEIIKENGIYKPALLPGFKVPLKKLLAVADRWAEAQ